MSSIFNKVFEVNKVTYIVFDTYYFLSTRLDLKEVPFYVFKYSLTIGLVAQGVIG